MFDFTPYASSLAPYNSQDQKLCPKSPTACRVVNTYPASGLKQILEAIVCSQDFYGFFNVLGAVFGHD